MEQGQDRGRLTIQEKLARLVQFPTVSSYDPDQEDEGAFDLLKSALPTLFPRVHASLRREEPSSRALLYTWPGKDPSLKPAILCAHFDVVPALSPASWKKPPFSGEICDQEVWGRGTQDIKVLMASALEAAEELLEKGFRPERTIYFAFGGDEEVGGTRGAGAIAAQLKARGINASFLLDEGGPISVGMLSFVKKPLALIGVAEKGYMDVELSVKGRGGHASMPPRETAPGKLARAVVALEKHPSSPTLTKTIRAFLSRLAPEASQPYRFLFSNLWITRPFILAAFGAAPTTNALIRTTAAVTMLSGSSKENVLADRAAATVNMRILPGDDHVSALARVQRLVEPCGVTARVKHQGHAVEPSEESETSHEGWNLIEKALKVSHPEAVCVPFLFSAGTDTKHYKGIADAMYRFTCLPQTSEDLKGIHGDDERVRIADLQKCARFYSLLMESL